MRNYENLLITQDRDRSTRTTREGERKPIIKFQEKR